jgi:hypothetical protein
MSVHACKPAAAAKKETVGQQYADFQVLVVDLSPFKCPADTHSQNWIKLEQQLALMF